jgi:hypothetical protein
LVIACQFITITFDIIHRPINTILIAHDCIIFLDDSIIITFGCVVTACYVAAAAFDLIITAIY